MADAVTKNTGVTCGACQRPHATVSTAKGPRSVACAEAEGLSWSAFPHASAPRYADSITFTVDQLDDLILCVDHALAEGVGYGHCLPGDAEYERARRTREALRATLHRFVRNAKRRPRRRL